MEGLHQNLTNYLSIVNIKSSLIKEVNSLKEEDLIVTKKIDSLDDDLEFLKSKNEKTKVFMRKCPSSYICWGPSLSWELFLFLGFFSMRVFL